MAKTHKPADSSLANSKRNKPKEMDAKIHYNKNIKNKSDFDFEDYHLNHFQQMNGKTVADFLLHLRRFSPLQFISLLPIQFFPEESN